MRIIRTDEQAPDDINDLWLADQIYNGIDVLATRQVFDAQLPQLDPVTAETYAFSKSIQACTIEMGLRGVAVDRARVAEVLDGFHDQLDRLEANLERIVLEGVGMSSFNWRSSPDRADLFYHHLGIPEIRRRGAITTDRAARERLKGYTIARPIVNHMNAMADIAEKIKKLRTKIDPDGRIRTTYNIAGTNTGRFSSSAFVEGTGGNMQNVEEALRSIFIADPKMKWCKLDAKQIQSRIVGGIEWNLFNDATYLDACESTDLHTFVAKLTWPNLPWTGSPKADKATAETIFYRHFTYRDLCKKLGHGSNFEGRPTTLSEQTGIPVNLVIAFQPKYFAAFPCHAEWHQWVASKVARDGHIIGITGRKRWFFGRRNDPDTIRQAIAYDPQASEAHIVNHGMLNVWRKNIATIMMHEHDGLVYAYPEELEDEVVPRLLTELEHPVDIGHGRTMVVPYEAKVGWNRGKFDAKTNPDGLMDYNGTDKRKRQPEIGILDRVVNRTIKRTA